MLNTLELVFSTVDKSIIHRSLPTYYMGMRGPSIERLRMLKHFGALLL